MNSIITTKTIESDYFGILAFITGGIAFIPWYYWIGKTVSGKGADGLGKGATFFASVLIVFLLIAYPFSFFGTNSGDQEGSILAIALNFSVFAVLGIYFYWNEAFRRKWNQIEHVVQQEDLRAGPIWTVLLGPIYLNFKINQAKGTER